MDIFKRNIFLHLNKFQQRIILYLTALGIAALSLMMLFLSYLYADSNNFLHTFPFFTIKICIVIALPIAAILILIACLYAYHLTNKLFGPYDRIIKELDSVIETRQKKELSVRKGDELFEELLKRINALIRQLP